MNMSRNARGRAIWQLCHLGRRIVVLALPLCAGCSSLTSYVAFPDPGRTKQATTVDADFKAVDIAAAADAAPALLKAQLDAMHAEQDSFSGVHTQAVISTFVDAPLDGVAVEALSDPLTGKKLELHKGLRAQADAALVSLLADSGGSDLPKSLAPVKLKDGTVSRPLAEIVEKLGEQRSRVQARELFLQAAMQEAYGRYGFGAYPSCDDVPGSTEKVYSNAVQVALTKLEPQDRVNARSELETMRLVCLDPKQATEIDGVYSGSNRISQAHARLIAAKAERDRQVASVNAQKAIVDRDRKAYNQAVSAAGSSLPAADAVKKATDDLAKAIGDLKGLSGKTGGHAEKLLAELDLDAANAQIDDITQVLASGKLPEGTKNYSKEIFLAARLTDDVKAIESAKSRAALIPPQLVIAQEQLQLKQAQSTVAAQDRRINLMQHLEDTLWEQVRLLSFSQAQMDLSLKEARVVAGRGGWAQVIPTNSADCNPNDHIPVETKLQTYEQMFCVSPVPTREALLHAAVYFVAAQGRLESQRYKLEYDLIDVDDELSVQYSSINLQRWNALLTPTINEIVTFNTLDSNTVPLALQALQVLGLGFIGHGVNK